MRFSESTGYFIKLICAVIQVQADPGLFCYFPIQMTGDGIRQLASNLPQLEHLDLRGCKQLKDVCVHHVVRHCPQLRSLALANCPSLTDAAMAEIAAMTTSLRYTTAYCKLINGCEGFIW